MFGLLGGHVGERIHRFKLGMGVDQQVFEDGHEIKAEIKRVILDAAPALTLVHPRTGFQVASV